MTHLTELLHRAFEAHPGREHVPAASVAVLAPDTSSEHTAAWGATPGTLFQAASISKPVAALAALRLVAQGRLDLDADVNTALTSWQLPAPASWKPVVTLRQLLCHGAALTVSGYPGYPAGAPLPRLPDILDGRPPANTGPVRVDGIPGLSFRYSGGGYVVLQQMLCDVTGRPFPDLVAELVLEPAGMVTATYRRPGPGRAAPAHVDGRPVPGGWHTYPEQAAAGLWCTPTDLVRFARAVQLAAAGAPGALLPAELAREMLSAQVPGRGLGVGLDGEGPHRRFRHGGSNHGYRCGLVALVDVGHAVAVMTNSDRGDPVVRTLIDAAARHTGWPDPPRFGAAELSGAHAVDQILAGYAGEYRTALGVALGVRVEGGELSLVAPGQPPLYLDLSTLTTGYVPATNASVTFTLDGDGRATTLTLGQYGTETVARRR